MSKRAEEMTIEELLREFPPGLAQVSRTPDGFVIEGMPHSPWPRAATAAYASAVLRERTARRLRRVAQLTTDGKTARQIGEIIASEENSPAAFPDTTVKAWRTRARSEGLLPRR